MRNSNSFVDDVIGGIDRSLKTLTGGHSSTRPNPGAEQQEPELSDDERKHVAGLMRVNHAGEICAQALYEGQALTAKSASAKASLLHAASDEQDHLSWCRQRLDQLDARPSVFDPLFYGASFALGVGAGLLGDRISLGFVEATEDQVVKHLEEHLESLPEQDEKSRVILEEMRADESRHGANALAQGGGAYSPSR
ncbi:2-polyprenyl-3-methyl-6-methoxy-1,4-benzoquinone monooxygenase [Pseudomonadales bacterium]|nr:2-polyprenyl-3-methyl-6-methoxy-1,4-benzoquinone monooxygenase [Pseudomonadales bacterium]